MFSTLSCQHKEKKIPLNQLFIRVCSGADEMVQCVKALASKPEDMGSIPGTYMLEIENLFL